MKSLVVVLSLILLAAIVVVPLGAQAQTIAATAAADPELSTLFTLLASANLLDVLDDADAELTVFAPTNAAFDAVPGEALNALLADPVLLTRVLTYHVIEGSVPAAELAAVASAPSMEMEAVGEPALGSELAFTADGDSVLVNGAAIVTADVEASNGVIHIIDAVLLPPDVAPLIGIELPAEPELVVVGTNNPGGIENDGIYIVDALLSGEPTAFGGFTDIASVESIAFHSSSDYYVTVDLVIGDDGAITAGGLLKFDGFLQENDSGGETLIAGENTGLIAPKGLQVLETLGMVAVADLGARDIKLFALDAEGDAAPVAVVPIGEGGSVWDVWYDLLNDTLYAAKTNGDLAAYDFFSETLGANGPDRVITPTDAEGNKISVNLHGIEIDYDTNTAIITDVGDAAVNSDGQIFVIRVISISDGPTPVDARIFGDQTQLGNPVDVILDGRGIFVAEKANDLLLYYANILELEGELNVPADIAVPALKAEGVAIYPTRESRMIEEMGLLE